MNQHRPDLGPRASIGIWSAALAAVLASTPSIAPGAGGAAGALPTPDAARARSGSDLATLSLISETTTLRAGSTHWIGARFTIKPGWHLYWRNPGESGMAPEVAFQAPDGVTFGQPVWPVGQRHQAPSSGVDYIYENDVVVLFPVEIAASLAGRSLTIIAQADWLVCHDVCLAGDGEATLSLIVGDDQVQPHESGAALIASARARAPRVALQSDGVRAWWEGDTLHVRAKGAERVTFMPYETEVFIEPVDAWVRGAAIGDELTLPFDGDLEDLTELSGALEVVRGGKTSVFEINVPRAAASR